MIKKFIMMIKKDPELLKPLGCIIFLIIFTILTIINEGCRMN